MAKVYISEQNKYTFMDERGEVNPTLTGLKEAYT